MQGFREQKTAFVTCLKKYLNHKRVLSQNSSWYRNASVADGISKCAVAFKMLERPVNEIDFKMLCDVTLLYKKYLQAILPSPNNKSYQSSLHNLETILTQANNYLKQCYAKRPGNNISL